MSSGICEWCNLNKPLTKHHVKYRTGEKITYFNDKRGVLSYEIMFVCRRCHDEIEADYELRGVIYKEPIGDIVCLVNETLQSFPYKRARAKSLIRLLNKQIKFKVDNVWETQKILELQLYVRRVNAYNQLKNFRVSRCKSKRHIRAIKNIEYIIQKTTQKNTTLKRQFIDNHSTYLMKSAEKYGDIKESIILMKGMIKLI